MKRIKTITEAFSMQPVTLTISLKRSSFNPEDDIEIIKLEKLDNNTNVYIGYNFDKQEKFRYLEKSVNVHYF